MSILVKNKSFFDNAFTIDTEEWFQVFYGFKYLRQSNWGEMDSHISRMVDTCIELLDRHKTRCTFFILGYIAEKNPQLIRRIYECGHEVASHGYGHQQVFKQTKTEFYNDIIKSKELLEDAIGSQVLGYRAPGFSIRPCDMWALDIIENAGYVYDSSLLHYSPKLIYVRPRLLEVAPNSFHICGRYLPTS